METGQVGGAGHFGQLTGIGHVGQVGGTGHVGQLSCVGHEGQVGGAGYVGQVSRVGHEGQVGGVGHVGHAEDIFPVRHKLWSTDKGVFPFVSSCKPISPTGKGQKKYCLQSKL